MIWFLPLAGAAAGALMNRKNPMQGALMGAAAGLTGGAALGAAGVGAAGAAGASGTGLLGGAAGSAGAAGAGAAGATGAAASGAGMSQAGLLTAETGMNSMGYLAPEMTGTIAEQAAAPVVDMSTRAGLLDKANYATGNAFSPGGSMEPVMRGIDKAERAMKPIGTAGGIAKTLSPPPEPMISPVAPNFGGNNSTLQQLATSQQQAQLAQTQQEYERRMAQRARIARMGGMA